jgi:hypothetical protein
MKIVEKVKTKAAAQMLNKMPEPSRVRQAFHFGSAKSIGILYQDDDERYFNKVRNFAKEIKDHFNVKTIRAIGYVPLKEKMLPIWQSQKLEFGYFTSDDLNWHLKPIQRTTAFKNEEFDILIDLSDGDVLPLAFLFKESKAKMKVCIQDSISGKSGDFLLMMAPPLNFEKYIQQIKSYLGNPALK